MTVFIILILVGVAGFFAYNKFFKKKEEKQEDPFISSELQEKLQKQVKREAPAVITEEDFKKSQLDNLEKVKKAPVVEPQPVEIPVVETPAPELVKDVEEIITKTVIETPVQVSEAPAKKRRKYIKRKRK